MNFIKILNAHTDTHWKQVDGPDTRCGIDYYFEDDDGKEKFSFGFERGFAGIVETIKSATK